MRSLGILLVALFAGSCTEDSVTELVVAIDSNVSIAEAPTIAFEVIGPAGETLRSQRFSRDANPLPQTLSVVWSAGADAPVSISARAESAAGTTLVRASAITGFVRGQRRLVELFLDARCEGVTCDAMQTCEAGECRAAARAPESLPQWMGTLTNRDSGMTDSGMTDSGMTDSGMTDSGMTDSSADTCVPSDPCAENVCGSLDDGCGGVRECECADDLVCSEADNYCFVACDTNDDCEGDALCEEGLCVYCDRDGDSYGGDYPGCPEATDCDDDDPMVRPGLTACGVRSCTDLDFEASASYREASADPAFMLGAAVASPEALAAHYFGRDPGVLYISRPDNQLRFAQFVRGTLANRAIGSNITAFHLGHRRGGPPLVTRDRDLVTTVTRYDDFGFARIATGASRDEAPLSAGVSGTIAFASLSSTADDTLIVRDRTTTTTLSGVSFRDGQRLDLVNGVVVFDGPGDNRMSTWVVGPDMTTSVFPTIGRRSGPLRALPINDRIQAFRPIFIDGEQRLLVSELECDLYGCDTRDTQIELNGEVAYGVTVIPSTTDTSESALIAHFVSGPSSHVDLRFFGDGLDSARLTILNSDDIDAVEDVVAVAVGATAFDTHVDIIAAAVVDEGQLWGRFVRVCR